MTNGSTIYERLQQWLDALTRAERQLANVLLENWPVSGPSSITSIAMSASVSPPTVARMAQKLGFRGFTDFQAALRKELEAQISNPITKHAQWSANVPDTHIVNRFADAIVQNLHNTLSTIDPNNFDAACDGLADFERKIFIAGGRITHTLAEYLFLHMQMVRPGVVLIPSSDGAWPHYVIGMVKGDILVLFDVRRYQNDLPKLAEFVSERGVQVLLITDQWGSPVSKHATSKFNCRIEVPSAWDSNVTIMSLAETMIAEVQTRTWNTTGGHMQDLEHLFDGTKLFRKFQ